MTEPTGQKPARINIELPPDLEAIYANLALINHSASEVIIDFARVMPNKPVSRVYSRIVLTPLNAKLLYRALGENLGKYEQKFGEITVPENVVIDPNRGFVK